MRGEQSGQLTLSPALSLYLDVIRIGLALGVFVTHAVKIPFGGPLPLEGYMGQEFVVGFFVLSGLLLPLGWSACHDEELGVPEICEAHEPGDSGNICGYRTAVSAGGIRPNVPSSGATSSLRSRL